MVYGVVVFFGCGGGRCYAETIYQKALD